MLYSTLTLSLLSLLPSVLAKTDLSGCTSSVSGPKLIWYVPETGELCEFLDCGGGRAPPKTTVPGCGAYEGTEAYKPSFLPGYGEAAKNTAVSSVATVIATSTSEVEQETSVATVTATSSSVSTGAAYAPSVVVSSATLSTITTAPQMPMSSGSVRIPFGTGSLSSSVHGGNNLTASATLSTGAPQNTGAAGVVGVNSFLGLVMAAAGLAVL